MQVDGRPSGRLRVEMRDNRGGEPVVFGPYTATAGQGLVEQTGQLVFPPAFALSAGEPRVWIRVESRGEMGGIDMVMTFALKPKAD